MTFEEMKCQYDEFGAFHDYVTVANAKYLDIIPKSFDGVFPEKCSCGSDMIINLARTKITCCNPRCYVKQGLALSELFSRFNYKGISDATCTHIYNALYAKNNELLSKGEQGLFISNSFLEILLLDIDKYPISFTQSAMGYDFLNGVHYIKQKELTFVDMIASLGLPEFDTTAQKLFSEFNSFEELNSCIKAEGGVSNFCENRGVHAPQKKFWLKVSLEDIAVASFIFASKIRVQGLRNLDICITGSLRYGGCRVTKSDFIAICNKESASRPIKELIKEAFSKYLFIPKEAIASLSDLLNGNLTKSNRDYAGVDDLMSDLTDNLGSVPVLEVRMTTAKKTVPFIVADYPSNSDKYLEGLRRGKEISFDGEKRDVLISSNELIEVIHSIVFKWEEDLIQLCQRVTEQKTEMHLF